MCGVGAEGNPVSMAVTSFVSLSLDPLWMAVCLPSASFSGGCLRSVSGTGDRFSDIDREPTGDGVAFVRGAWGGMEAVP
ncbi:hypothetical protein P6281_09040 [Mycobacterium sp. 5-140-3-2]|uniref:hypothetical protein n=1 Tax=Mycobacterium sp. 5-140-3-2 TaxID=3037257 RepID=UPI002D774C58|nr:hypothetical protein [Mycobacterium sp. 5-140-3-2]WRU84009.1 hypothetical protein P6281_09040 [Mycobacterium sp. 5-140-3-2]